MDKLIADAVADSKKSSKWHRPEGKGMSREKAERMRRILNAVFMIGFVACVIIYFAFPENKVLFFSVGFGAMIIKIIEFVIRFML